MSAHVRTRFAPSPTGFMHVGGVRTALFAWLVAKQNKGQFVLRIEDTDQAREVKGSKEHIMESLRWLGLEWDEGPDVGGKYGPYSQSQRLSIYLEWTHKMEKNGLAYADPTSPAELDLLRKSAISAKKPFLYREHRPLNPPKWDGKTPLRFKCTPKNYAWSDEVMGELKSGPEVIDDFILIKSDGYPTYNFAHIIDDHLMKITHVIRSQEFLSSVPKFLSLYEALEITPPALATLPYVLEPTGKQKLSKRHGAKDILDYAKSGYLAPALINFLATLGWNDGTTQEIFTVDELVKKFNLSRVQKGGAKFDEKRLNWLNGHLIRSISLDELYAQATSFWPNSAKNSTPEYKKRVLALLQERLKYLSELSELSEFFFTDPATSDLPKTSEGLEKQPVLALLESVSKILVESEFKTDALEKTLRTECSRLQVAPVKFFSLIRRVVTGSDISPGLFETLEVLGKETALRRMKSAISHLEKHT